ncbi:MAG: hypothetical protein ACI9O4_001847 [Chitinophagales bacterium]|jgi:hypothetical protein
MQDKVTYEYAIIRLVPKVEREEFLNIGVILFSKRKKYLGIKYKIDAERIHAFSNEVDIDLIKKYMESWELICQGEPKGGIIGTFDIASRFRWLVASRSTIIQSSRTHPGLCGEPEQVLDDIFIRYVL